MKNNVFLFAAVAGLALSGCAGQRFTPRPGLMVAEAGQLPPPSTSDLISPSRPFVIGPLDQISVEVYGLPEFSRAVQVDSSGQVSLPLVGSIQAAGKTPAQVATEYAASLRSQYIRDPRVTVNLTDTVSQTVSVGGSVGAPGIYPVTPHMTLLRAIARAEGVSEFGLEKQVVVYRRVNNRDMAALYDLGAIRQGLYPDPEIYANDVIEVGQSRGRRIFRDLITAAPLLSVPLITLLN